MRPCLRVLNHGILQRTVWKIQLSVRASVFGLTRRGILACRQATVHIFAKKPNARYRPAATLTIIVNLFSGRMPVLPGAIYKFGPTFMTRASKCGASAALIHAVITL